jgi:nitroreductase
MDFLDLVRKRQSERKYSPRPVPRDVVERCLEAARLAPSACHSQPWTFIVVDDEELRRKLAEAAFSGVYAMNAFAREAPVFIVVVTERSKYAARLGGQFRGVQYSLIDIGIACEHMVLQAAEEGVGTCWLGWFNEKAVKQILDLPREAKTDIILSMGYPASELVKEKKRKALREIRRYYPR